MALTMTSSSPPASRRASSSCQSADVCRNTPFPPHTDSQTPLSQPDPSRCNNSPPNNFLSISRISCSSGSVWNISRGNLDRISGTSCSWCTWQLQIQSVIQSQWRITHDISDWSSTGSRVPLYCRLWRRPPNLCTDTRNRLPCCTCKSLAHIVGSTSPYPPPSSHTSHTYSILFPRMTSATIPPFLDCSRIHHRSGSI